MFALFASAWDFSYSLLLVHYHIYITSSLCQLPVLNHPQACSVHVHPCAIQTCRQYWDLLIKYCFTAPPVVKNVYKVHWSIFTKSQSDSPSLISKDKLQHVVCSVTLHGDWLSDDYIQKHGLRAEGRKDHDWPCVDKLFKNPAHDIELIYQDWNQRAAVSSRFVLSCGISSNSQLSRSMSQKDASNSMFLLNFLHVSF